MLNNIFSEYMGSNKKLVIGALHFMPLVGYPGFTNFDEVLEKAKNDLKIMEAAGIDSVIIENNYNLPHKIKETEECIQMMIDLIKEIKKITSLPLGISLLWNDYAGAFRIAKECNASYIRVPVFVDSVETDFGKVIANSAEVISERKKQGAENVLILADIQVKHATMLDKNKSIETSAMEAKKYGANGIIVTGKWTGDAPDMKDLISAKNTVGKSFPVIIGSGANENNVQDLLKYADSIIVSTSLKEGEAVDFHKERNLKPYRSKIDFEKVKKFMNAVKNMSPN